MFRSRKERGDGVTSDFDTISSTNQVEFDRVSLRNRLGFRFGHGGVFTDDSGQGVKEYGYKATILCDGIGMMKREIDLDIEDKDFADVRGEKFYFNGGEGVREGDADCAREICEDEREIGFRTNDFQRNRGDERKYVVVHEEKFVGVDVHNG